MVLLILFLGVKAIPETSNVLKLEGSSMGNIIVGLHFNKSISNLLLRYIFSWNFKEYN